MCNNTGNSNSVEQPNKAIGSTKAERAAFLTTQTPLFSVMNLFRFQPLNCLSMKVTERQLAYPGVSQVAWFGQRVAYLPLGSGGRHLEAAQLEPYRQIGDPAMDSLMDFLHKHGHTLKAEDDLLNPQVAYPPHVQKRIDDFLAYYSKLPDWCDIQQIERGQRVFLKYIGAISVALLHKSLIPGFSIPKIAQVICATAYLAPPSTRESVQQRLMDTGALIAACFGYGAKPLLAGGEAWKTTLYVRILHSKVRRALLRRTGSRAWDTKELGVPINQEDLAATALAFSCNSILGVEFVGGFEVPKEDKEDYLALWRYIGWLLGVHTVSEDGVGIPGLTSTNVPSSQSSEFLRSIDPCGPGWLQDFPDPFQHSRTCLESIILHLCHPNEISVKVSHHLLHSIGPNRAIDRAKKEIPKSTAPAKTTTLSATSKDNRNDKTPKFGFYARAAACRAMIGDPLADALELPAHPALWGRLTIRLRLFLVWWVLRAYTWISFVPIVNTWFFHFHARTLRRFYDVWKEVHEKKLTERLVKTTGTTTETKRTMTMTTTNENKTTSDTGADARSEKTTVRVCPFALVAEPIH